MLRALRISYNFCQLYLNKNIKKEKERKGPLGFLNKIKISKSHTFSKMLFEPRDLIDRQVPTYYYGNFQYLQTPDTDF